jgi:hypothetical protein
MTLAVVRESPRSTMATIHTTVENDDHYVAVRGALLARDVRLLEQNVEARLPPNVRIQEIRTHDFGGWFLSEARPGMSRF